MSAEIHVISEMVFDDLFRYIVVEKILVILSSKWNFSKLLISYNTITLFYAILVVLFYATLVDMIDVECEQTMK